MTAKMEVMMEQLQASGSGLISQASVMANPQLESVYNAFPPLPQLSNLEGMTAPLGGISPKATAPPFPFSIYTSGNAATNTVNALALHNML